MMNSTNTGNMTFPKQLVKPNRKQKIQREHWLKLFLQRHREAFVLGLNRLLREPLATLLTVMVIGIALALPTVLLLIVKNGEVLSEHWQDTNKITLFLKLGQSEVAVERVLQSLRMNPKVSEVRYVSPEQGLAEFEKSLGVTNLLRNLPSNPLPGVIDVYPTSSLQQDSQAMVYLSEQLQQYPEVDSIQLDVLWVKRFLGILALIKQVILGLGIALSAGVVLVVGNTIRLIIVRYRKELEIIKLIGATDAFVQRPFLYSGLLFGCFGALIAWLIVGGLIMLLDTPLRHLAALYPGLSGAMIGLTFLSVVYLLAVGAILGLLGSYGVVRYYLRKLDNR